jgi:hypothetical protein
MTKNELREQIARASKLIETWPAWKQNVLVLSSRPSVSSPRPPVDNRAVRDDSRAREAPSSHGQ